MIYYRGIGDNGAKEIANALKENKSLTLLSLSYNKIGDAGASSLAASLKDNNSLTSLDLGNNDIVGFLFFWLKAFVTQHSLLVNTFPSTFPLKPV